MCIRDSDEGVAFRYVIPNGGGIGDIEIERELTSFTFSSNCFGYAEYGTEGEYRLRALKDIKGKCELPLLIENKEKQRYCLLCQADLFDYARGFVRVDPQDPNKLNLVLANSVIGDLPFRTPWRVIRASEDPGYLLESSYIMYNLAEPCALSDTSWIKPGKVMRVLPVTTQAAKNVIDFASENGIQYAELDTGWYGNERDPNADARTYLPQVNVEQIINYGSKKGVGLILYVNRIHLRKQIDQILPIYRRWGVSGLKFGFVDGRTQRGIQNVHSWVKKAAEHRSIVDIHDNYRPTGLSFTFPNLLTQEGIRGNEHMPTSRHNAILPFTRFVVGAGDYTFCYLYPRLKTTSAHQLALSVIFFSPLQFVYWYGRPESYRNCLGRLFFRELPTTWDETKALISKIGRCVAVARRKGERYFLGVITNEEKRQVKIPLSFLGKGSWRGTIFTDHPKKELSIIEKTVDSSSILSQVLQPNGGLAAYFEKK